MSKVKASQNKAEQVETKPDEVKDESAKDVAQTSKETEPAKAAEKVDTHAEIEAKKVNSKFDEKLSGEAIPADKDTDSDEKIPEQEVADDKDSGDKKVDETEQQDEAEVVSGELAERAISAGLSKEQIERFSTVEDLEHALDMFEARQSEKATTVVDKTEEKPPEKTDDAFDCGLDPDAYDEGLIKAVNKLGGDLTARIKKLEGENSALTGKIRESETAETTKWFDGKIAELGEDFEDVLGKGTIKDVKEGSPQFKARAALDRKMNVLHRSYELAGEAIPTKDELFSEALLILHKEKIKQKDLKPITGKLRLRASQTIARGSTKIPSLTPIDIARQANKKFDEEHFGT